MNYISSFLYRICDWIMRLAFVNLLWIGFTIAGLVLFGFYPATIAMFSVIRKWITGYTDIPIFSTFWKTYKSEWLKGNLLGIILTGISSLIYLEISIINHSAQPLVQWSKYPLFLFIIIFGLLVLYTFPSYVHYNVNLFNVLKNAFFILLINPFYNTVMVLGLVLIYFLARILPPLLFFFGGSASAFIVMWACYQSFLNVERKKEKLKAISNEP